MRRILLFCLSAAALLTATARIVLASEAIDLASSTAWTFTPASGPQHPAVIPVPSGGWRLHGFPQVTEGTYQRRIAIPRLPGEIRQTTLLEFEAVNWEAKVYAGPDAEHLKLVCTHLSAWTPFRADISSEVTPGQPAIVRVQVRDRTLFRDSAGHFTVPAGPEWNDRAARGIIRGVRLLALPSAYIDAVVVRPSTYARTLSWSVTVHNSAPNVQRLKLNGSLQPAAYLTLQGRRSAHPIAYPSIPNNTFALQPNETRVLKGSVKWIPGRQFDWKPNIPYRPAYRAELHELAFTIAPVQDGADGSKHQVSTRFGFCTPGQTATGYSWNGIPINLRGDSLPEGTIGTDAFSRLPGFLPPSGGANPGWPGAVANYLKLNFNVVRMHQIPCTRYMMDVCDELGLLVIPETAIRGGGVSPENITENPEAFTTHLRELIRRDRNHPSVVKWSLENELPNVPEPFLKRLYDVCQQEDWTRPCSIDVFDHSPSPNWPQFAVIDHYSQPAGAELPAGGTARPGRPHGEGEYVWPFGGTSAGPVWFALETRSMRAHDNSDLRPYTLIDVWPGVIPGLTPVNFPDPHLPPDSLEQGGRSAIDTAAPWQQDSLRLIQRSFAPVAAFDLEYDRVNMHTNARGEWPTEAPTIIGGASVQRTYDVFNDELEGDDEVRLVLLPVLRISGTEVQPLPEISSKLHIAPGLHKRLTIMLPAPLVALNTSMEVLVTVYKGSVQKFSETHTYIVQASKPDGSNGKFDGLDTTTRGNWVDADGSRIYGKEAFLLPTPGGRTTFQMPDLYLSRAVKMEIEGHNEGSGPVGSADGMVRWDRVSGVTDPRLPWSRPDRSDRTSYAFQSTGLEQYFRADCRDGKEHILSLYLLNYLGYTAPVDIELYDLRGNRILSRKIDGDAQDNGVYVRFRITGAVYISIKPITSLETTVSGVFLDPIPSGGDRTQ